jgi:hypothetical protein
LKHVRPRFRPRRLARARASGPKFSNFLQRLFYAEFEVLRQLKGRRLHLSLHDYDDLEQIGTDSRVIFRKHADRVVDIAWWTKTEACERWGTRSKKVRINGTEEWGALWWRRD